MKNIGNLMPRNESDTCLEVIVCGRGLLGEVGLDGKLYKKAFFSNLQSSRLEGVFGDI